MMSKRTLFRGIFILCILAGLLLAAIQIARAQDYMLNGDFFHIWLGGRAIYLGEDPYDESSWQALYRQHGADYFPSPKYLYPLPLAVVLLPLGMLEQSQAAVAWVFLSLVMILVSAVILLRLWPIRSSAPYVLPLLAGLFVFRPVMVTLRNGQLGALWLLVVTSALFLWSKERWFFGGLVLAALFLKPSLGVGIICLVVMMLLLRGKWQALAGILSGTSALVLLGLIWDKDWILRYLPVGSAKAMETFGYQPTAWGLLYQVMGENLWWAIGVGGGMLAAVLLLYIWFLQQKWSEDAIPLALAMGMAISIALLFAPYLWAYDQILLGMPILAAMGYLAKQRLPYLLVAPLVLWVAALAIGLLFIALKTGNDTATALVPAACLGLVSVTARREL